MFIIAKNSAEKFVFMMYDIIFAEYQNKLLILK